MDRWAAKYAGRAHFICVGCAGPELAAAFVKRLHLQHCTTAYIADQNQMPSWGQLGCNGFIVLDSNLQLISACTSALNQVGELAFKHVEALIEADFNGLPMPKVCPGEIVRLNGLTGKPELNGQIGVCLKPATDGRCLVKLQSGRQLSIRPENLISSGHDDGEDYSSDGSEEDGS